MHTLSKAFDISKKPRDSSVGYASKAMECSWFTQESLARKPCWWADSKLYSSRYSKRELDIIVFWIFFHRLAAETLVYSYW